MGFFDRKSTTTNQQDILNRNVAAENLDGLSIVGSENVRVLDGGAIGGIENTARNAILANAGLVDESLDFGRTALLATGAAFETAGNQVQRVLETQTGRSPTTLTALDFKNNAVKYTAVAAAVIAALYLWGKK